MGYLFVGYPQLFFLSAFEVGITEPSPIPTADLTFSNTSSGLAPSELAFLAHPWASSLLCSFVGELASLLIQGRASFSAHS